MDPPFQNMDEHATIRLAENLKHCRGQHLELATILRGDMYFHGSMYFQAHHDLEFCGMHVCLGVLASLLVAFAQCLLCWFVAACSVASCLACLLTYWLELGKGNAHPQKGRKKTLLLQY